MISRAVGSDVVAQSFDPASPVFAAHIGGKLAVRSTMALTDRAALSLAYTPGVAEVSAAIAADESLADTYTWRSRLVAVISDGTAVLGLGDIGPAAALPVMEGKCALFAEFAGLNSVPIVLSTTDTQEIIDTVVRIAPSFGGINLEDISAPRCFEIERRLRELLPIPVFHDDQHGTAIVVLAALRNAALLTGRTLADLRVVISGAGAAGVACAKILLAAGVGDLAVADSRGIVHPGREDLNPVKRELAQATNRAGLTGSLEDAMTGADVFIGVSAGVIGETTVARMADESIIFALANPTPEVDPVVAHRHAAVVATGRSDLPNQINNVLAFPGVFAGAFDAGARQISEGMKLAAAAAIGAVVADEVVADRIVPAPFDERVAPAVRLAVAEQARREGQARIPAGS
ncbi:MAG: NADP-dependent malic enzyme [Actinomycetota bacterium]|nr:NADP-dependent malic enzyme [Actinomycetota bacterium]